MIVNWTKTFCIIFIYYMFTLPNVAFGYGEAGCGPGSMIFKRNSTVSQSLALTTNNISAPTQTVAVTMHTSNCTAKWSQYRIEDQERMQFIAHNFWNLKSELARGQGETLNALAEIHGCKDTNNPIYRAQTIQLIDADFNPDHIAQKSMMIKNICSKGDHS